LYVSFKSEVETYTIIAEALRKRKKVIVPKVNPIDNVLILYDLRSISELEKGYMGIAEPRLGQDRVVALNTVDLVIAPGTAFDRTGKRLGYGGGYYDRLLADICNIPVIALAYSEQILDKIPAEDHDVNVDIIVTEYEIIRIRDAKNSDA
jgi:5-formyltetrahydrofolate cyclo-ligase